LLLERAAYSKEENRIKIYKNKSQNKNSVRIKPLATSVVVLLVCMSSLSFLFTNDSEGLPIGGEFQVNTYLTNEQAEPSAAMDLNGNFVIAWNSDGQDGSGYGIYAKRYDSNGNELVPPVDACKGGEVGNEFRVNNYTTDAQGHPSTAMDSNGNFMITWQSYGQDGSAWGIYAQRYDNNGNLLGGEFQVNTYTTSEQWWPSVAMDSNGNFVIAWISDGQDGDSYGIFAQHYDSSGNPLGGEFQVNIFTTNNQRFPSVAMDSNGNFVITWVSDGQDGDNMGIYAQRYNSNGNPLGGEFQVNTYTTGNQWHPSTAMDYNGNFVIAWMSDGIFAQHYDNNGNPLGGEFLVNTFTPGSQTYPSTAMDSNGNFVIVWSSDGQDGDDLGVYAQYYDDSGNPLGDEFQVNTYITENQYAPSAAMDSTGDLVIAWESWGPDQDGFGSGIYAQRYDNITVIPPIPPTITTYEPGGTQDQTYIQGEAITIKWTASDDNPLPQNPINITYGNSTSGWTTLATHEVNDGIFNWDTSTVPCPGTYWMNLSVYDSIGQTAFDISNHSFEFECPINYPPIIQNVKAEPDPQTVGKTVTICANLLDEDTHPSNHTVRINITIPNGTTLGNFSMGCDATGVCTYTSSFDIPGTYSYVVWARDPEDNQAKGEGTFIVEEPPRKKEEYNWKPMIALLFTLILLILGILISHKRPRRFTGKLGKDRLYTFLVFSLPFVITETLTGIISFLTGLLSMPPILGVGLVVDLAILIIGIIVPIVASTRENPLPPLKEKGAVAPTSIIPPKSPPKTTAPPPPSPRKDD
jgi:hypothetical protein